MNTIKAEKLDIRDSITTGISTAISLIIFFVVGKAAGVTPIGTVASISITAFFTSVIYMLLVSKTRKRGTSLIMGTINTLLSLMAVNVIGVIASVVGWLMAEIVVSTNHYKNRKVLIFAYILDCTPHSAECALSMYLSNAQRLVDRQKTFRPIDEALAVYLKMFTWPMFSITVALTVVTSLLSAVLSTRILKKHFEKAGLL